MNPQTHQKAFHDQILREINGEASEVDRHNTFYNEYLAVMDMTAEFYLSTVDRIFKNREIALNKFSIDNKKTLLDARYFISVTLTFAPELQAEIICSPS